MKHNKTVLFIPLFFLFLSSCNNKEVTLNYPFLQKENENITLLFSDDHFIHDEGNYYDALLDVKKRYPEKIRTFTIIHSSDRDIVRHYEITEFPTLLVIHNEAVSIRIQGALQKAEILDILEEALLH